MSKVGGKTEGIFVRVSKKTRNSIDLICKIRKWPIADVIEEAVVRLEASLWEEDNKKE